MIHNLSAHDTVQLPAAVTLLANQAEMDFYLTGTRYFAGHRISRPPQSIRYEFFATDTPAVRAFLVANGFSQVTHRYSHLTKIPPDVVYRCEGNEVATRGCTVFTDVWLVDSVEAMVAAHEYVYEAFPGGLPGDYWYMSVKAALIVLENEKE